MVDNDNDWTAVSLDNDLLFGTIRSIEVTMMADIKEEFEKLARVGEENDFYLVPLIYYRKCLSFIICFTHLIL